MRLVIACLTASLVSAGSAAAFQTASDDASDPVYDNGWQTGDDGGSGWNGGWQLTSYVSTPGSAAAQDVASSTANGGGDVDTGGRAFHMSASGGAESAASRYLANALAVGEVVSADLDIAGAELSSTAQLLLSGTGPTRLRIGAFGSVYGVVDDSGVRPTSILLDGDPVTVRITVTGADAYSVTLTPLAGSQETIAGTLAGSGSIDHVVFDVYQPEAAAREMYFNRLTVPESSAAALEATALAPFALLLACCRLRPSRDARRGV